MCVTAGGVECPDGPTFAECPSFSSQPGGLRIHFHSSTIDDVYTADSVFISFQYHSFSSIVTTQEFRIPAAPVIHLSKLNGPDDPRKHA